MAVYTNKAMVAREVVNSHGSNRWGLDFTDPYMSRRLVIRSKQAQKMTTSKLILNLVKEER